MVFYNAKEFHLETDASGASLRVSLLQGRFPRNETPEKAALQTITFTSKKL